MTIRITYTFSQAELARMSAMARQRQATKDAAGIRDGRMIARGVDAHLLGLAGEYAVAQLFGGALDARTRLGGDDGEPDIVLPDGRTVEVKTRSEPGYAFLLSPGSSVLRADYGALVWRLPLSPLTVEIAGVIAAPELARCAYTVNYGHGPRVAVRAEDMRRVFRP